MRKAIRDMLVAPGAVPSVGGRVFEVGQAAENTPRPYLIVEEGSQSAPTPFGGAAEPVTVFIEGPASGSGGKTALRIVDQVEREVRAALANKDFLDEDTSERLMLVYQGNAGTDVVPPSGPGTLPYPGRAVLFTAYTLGWQSQQTFSPDPIPALAAMVPATWGVVQTDPTTWNPSDASPAIYWRVSQVVELQRTHWGAWVSVLFRGHVIVNSDEARRSWVRRTAEYATALGRVWISDGSQMLLMQVGADYEADPFREGQLAITGRYGVLRSTLPMADAPVSVVNNSGISLPAAETVEMTVSAG